MFKLSSLFLGAMIVTSFVMDASDSGPSATVERDGTCTVRTPSPKDRSNSPVSDKK